jgi:hypothetical protein
MNTDKRDEHRSGDLRPDCGYCHNVPSRLLLYRSSLGLTHRRLLKRRDGRMRSGHPCQVIEKYVLAGATGARIKPGHNEFEMPSVRQSHAARSSASLKMSGGGLRECPNAVADEPIQRQHHSSGNQIRLRRGFSHLGALALNATRTTARNHPSISTTQATSISRPRIRTRQTRQTRHKTVSHHASVLIPLICVHPPTKSL